MTNRFGNENPTVDMLERIAAGIEKLAEDPVINVESGPPVCPHCKRMNPVVQMSEREASGPLGEVILLAQCSHCKQVFYAVPRMYDCVVNIEEVTEIIAEVQDTFRRAEVSNG